MGGLCSSEVLPFKFEATVKEIEDVLSELSASAAESIDLTHAIAETRKLRRLVRKLERCGDKGASGEEARIMNEALKRLGRLLIPVNYTKAGPFDQDLAVSTPPLPGLQPILRLIEMNPGSDERRFLATRLQRETNRTLHAILEAKRVVERTVWELDRGAHMKRKTNRRA